MTPLLQLHLPVCRQPAPAFQQRRDDGAGFTRCIEQPQRQVDPLHLFRARWLFERVGVKAATSPTSTRVDRIDPRLRLFYTAREAGAVVATLLEGWGWLPADLKTKLQEWSHGLS